MTVEASLFAYSFELNDGTGETPYLSESNTLTTYDSETNSFYVNIPKGIKIATVEVINADVLENYDL